MTLVTDPATPGERLWPMAEAAGWWSLHRSGAGAGTRYQFEVGGRRVPDPASRYQPDDVHGPSEVVDLTASAHARPTWRGRPWHEAVLYELHVGTFSPEGTFDGVRRRLDHLVDLGVTALQLMPVADFAGARGWGYDGVLPFAPTSSYGCPADLKALIDAAHDRGLMVLLDVVYNHLGPEGNFLHLYAPGFFTDRTPTPWGPAIDFSRPEVRRFVVENALFWLDGYGVDGLRLDAVHAIDDPTRPHVLTELAGLVRAELGPDRYVHLVLENDANEARHLARDPGGAVRRYDAQWNDDLHHVLHHLATGEAEVYYADYTDDPVGLLARALTSGFVYQGEPSRHRGGAPRGEPSGHLPPTAFVSFLQNHDQVGNRAFGERLATLAEPRIRAALTTLLLLAPQVPMLFMGEEWASRQPFLYFTDFGDDLAAAVRAGRLRDLSRVTAWRDAIAAGAVPDPNAAATFQAAKLDWSALAVPDHAAWLTRHRELLRLRARWVVPLLPHLVAATAERLGPRGLRVTWRGAGAQALTLLANLGEAPLATPWPRGRLLAASAQLDGADLPRWTVAFRLAGAGPPERLRPTPGAAS